MKNPISYSLVVIVTLFALLGQAYAVASMTCEMNGHHNESAETVTTNAITKTVSPHSEMSDHGVSNHAGHQAASVMQQDQHQHAEDGDDCCQVKCMCPANACSSFSFVSSYSQTTMNATDSDKIQSALSTPALIRINSLYRPPIFA